MTVITHARIGIQRAPLLMKSAGKSPVDALERDEQGNPDYGVWGKHAKDLRGGDHRILRHGHRGAYFTNGDGEIQYGQPPQGHKEKPVIDKDGKPLKQTPDQHGFIYSLASAAKRTGIALPMAAIMQIAEAANQTADRAIDDHAALMMGGAAGEGRERAKNMIMVAPFLAMLEAAEQHLSGDQLRQFMSSVASDFRGGKADALTDGTASPVPLPLAAVARQHLTTTERRDGKKTSDVGDDKDKEFHGKLTAFHGAAKRGAAGRGNPDGLISALHDLKGAGRHHTKALTEHAARTREEDAKQKPGWHDEQAKVEAERLESKQDASVPPMSDDELTKLKAVTEQLRINPTQFIEVQAIPPGTRSAHKHLADDLAVAAEREGAKVQQERLPLEAVVARALMRALQHRTNGHITNAQRGVAAPAWHHVAHHAILTDRHDMARKVVEGSTATPETSLLAQLGLDPYRVARHLTRSLPAVEEFLKILTESGAVPAKLLNPPKADKKKEGADAKKLTGQAGPAPGKPAIMVVKGNGGVVRSRCPLSSGRPAVATRKGRRLRPRRLRTSRSVCSRAECTEYRTAPPRARHPWSQRHADPRRAYPWLRRLA